LLHSQWDIQVRALTPLNILSFSSPTGSHIYIGLIHCVLKVTMRTSIFVIFWCNPRRVHPPLSPWFRIFFILSLSDIFLFVIYYSIYRMPYFPYFHFTPQKGHFNGSFPLLSFISLSIIPRFNYFINSLYCFTKVLKTFFYHLTPFFICFCCLQTIISYTLKSLRKYMLYHTTYKGQHIQNSLLF